MKLSAAILLVVISVCTCVRADDIRSTNGAVYKNAKIVRTEPDGLVIQHRAGVAKVPFAELSLEIQKKYHYDAQRAAAALASAKRAEAATMHEKSYEQVIKENEQWIAQNFGRSPMQATNNGPNVEPLLLTTATSTTRSEPARGGEHCSKK